MTSCGRTLVLLGDSIFDNAAYVAPGEADVAGHLRRRIGPAGWQVDLRAVDGHMTHQVGGQLSARALETPCHFVLSTGGNDALEHVGLLDAGSEPLSPGQLLSTLHDIKEMFRASYREALSNILTHEQPLIVCTIYNPCFTDPQVQKAAEAALSIFNDVIQDEAIARNLPVIDLRRVCSEAAHFANPIEPSGPGGDRIAAAIENLLPPA